MVYMLSLSHTASHYCDCEHTMSEHRKCRFCGDPISMERPYRWCMASNCVAQGLAFRRQNYSLVLLPKQGFTYVARADVANSPTRSSGK